MACFDAAGLVERWLNEAPLSLVRVEGGRNSDVTRVRATSGDYALKRYVRADGAMRLQAEVAALDFLNRNGVSEVPGIVGADREANAVLMTWLGGTTVGAATEADVDACVEFVRRLHGLAGADGAEDITDAKEACGAVATILRQIDGRIDRLTTIAAEIDGLGDFLSEAIAERRTALSPLLERYPDPFPANHRILSPSDFGLHNARRLDDGRIAFLDFEYFGWDDPVKLVADFVLHPGMGLSEGLCARFKAQMRTVFSCMPSYDERLHDLLPAYRLRWSLIMLNPLLDLATSGAADRAAGGDVAKREIDRARRFLDGERVTEMRGA